jgi:rhodanese-related sulfurtransferase
VRGLFDSPPPRFHNIAVAVPRITRDELAQRIAARQPLLLVDARLKYPFEHSSLTLPGAVRCMADDALPSVPDGVDVVVYDSDPHELAASYVAARFIRAGIRAAALKGGIVEWLAGNLPVAVKDAPRTATPERGALRS